MDTNKNYKANTKFEKFTNMTINQSQDGRKFTLKRLVHHPIQF